MYTLSKSDFKVAMTCPTKLYYRKLKYPTTMEGNEFMEMLAEGGYMVGKLATLLYPGGVDLSEERSPEKSAEITKELLLNNENIIIYEAGILYDNLIIRIDILEKKGDVLNLIEVKAASFDGDNVDESINGLGEYIEDVVFQNYVLSSAFPQFKINPYLFMPDKAKTTNIDGLNGQFSIKKKESKPGSKFKEFDVRFNGKVTDLLKDDILTLVDLREEVNARMPFIMTQTNNFVSSLEPKLNKISTPIGIHCKSCEFHSEDVATDGFKQCWGKLAVKANILDLIQLGNVNRHHDGIVNSLISEGKVKLSDFPIEILNPDNRKKNKPYHNNRPFMQLTFNNEWISDELKAELRMLKKKIHFIDFETSRMALPYHKDMRPYENVAFQWSCHTLDTSTGLITHKEWINTGEAFPNFAFAESLMAATNDGGEIMIWSKHENSVLKDIYYQMEKYGYSNDVLAEWIKLVVKFDKEDTTELTDMCDMAKLGYFHPNTNGRTSIKVTLPAILSCYTDKNIKKILENFEPGLNLYKKENNEVVSPYYLLPAVKEIDNYDVREGTGAMRAYQDMLYGEIKNDPLKKESVKQALLKYCKLDTLAMVLIYKHWMSL
jgi:hypothetical protein